MILSVWEKESFFAPSDVIIAGSGFTGLWAAYYLKKKHPRSRITIIDRGIVPMGASTRNAGFACFGSVTELARDIGSMGVEYMQTLVEMRYRGLLRIRKVFGEKEIDYIDSGGYELISETSRWDGQELTDQMAQLNKLLQPVLRSRNIFRFDNDKIKKFGFAGVRHLISNKHEGCLHSGKLCAGLLARLRELRVNIIPATEITGFEKGHLGITVTTGNGLRLEAQQLLICTNAFARQLLPQLEVTPARGQVLLTAPVPSLKIRGSFHYDEGYYYFRNLGKRLLLGGARNLAIEQETTTQNGITDNIQKALESFLSTHLLPGVAYTITDRWSGIMGMGAEKMPIVKKVRSNVYCAVRMNGMGVALAPIVGEQVAAMLM